MCAGKPGTGTQAPGPAAQHDAVMTQQIATPARRRTSPLAIGLLSVCLGIVLLLVAAYLLLLRDGGWPWHASVATRSDGGSVSATAEINDDGTIHRFTGTPVEAQAWLETKESDLKELHGITTKIAVGEVLRKVGLLLLAFGGGVLLWRFVRSAGRRASRAAPRPGQA